MNLSALRPKSARMRTRAGSCLNSVDVAILCLPDDAAREAVGLIDAKSKTRVIDASTAYRVDPAWAYGFAEIERGTARRELPAPRASPTPAAIRKDSSPW